MRQSGILLQFRTNNPIQVRQIGKPKKSRHDQRLGTDRTRSVEQSGIRRQRIHQNGMIDCAAPEDKLTAAQMVNTLSQSGFKADPQELSERFGMKLRYEAPADPSGCPTPLRPRRSV